MFYNQIVNDISVLPDFISYYTNELESARQDVKIKGNIEKNISMLPGISEHRFRQLQEIEAVLEYMNLQLRKLRKKYFQKYLENYNRQLNSRDAEKYAEAEEEVVEYECLVNEVALIRNEYLAISKGIETKNFMLGHLVKLKCAGFEDYTM
jgi:hypothetical protein